MRQLDAEQTLALPLRDFILIEASAGTGKTYTIGNLYLRMICEGWSVQQILLVTFTVAATDELRGRIRLRLRDALQRLEGNFAQDDRSQDDVFLDAWQASLSEPEKTKLRLKLAMRSMDEAAIYTIHAFCQRALGEHAFDSHQSFDCELIHDDTMLRQQAVRDWWRRQTYPLKAMDYALLQRAWPNIDHLSEALHHLRFRQTELLPAVSENMEDCWAQWHELADCWNKLAEQWQQRSDALFHILKESPALSRSQKSYSLKNLEAYYLQWDHWFSSEQWWQWPDAAEKLRADTLQEESKASKRGSDRDLEDGFFLLCQQWLEQATTMIQHFRLASLKHARHHVDEQLKHSKQQQNVLSFQDQLEYLHDALQANHDLGVALRQRFPIAMIDEFQDTDALQYGIFQKIYQHEHHCMVMIGDPKQAIYAFRGGDIFTYLRAANDAAQRWTLDTNWRSHPRLIQAVNTLLSMREQAFDMEGVDFSPVHASSRDIPLLQRDGQPCSPLRMFAVAGTLDSKNKIKPYAKANAESIIYRHLANDIAALLSQSANGAVQLDGQPLQACDIAILVRNHRQAKAIQQALNESGIAAVSRGQSNVWQSEEAQGLQLILRAIITPNDGNLLRQAMSSSLLGLDFRQIAEHQHSEQQWAHWCDSFDQLRKLWQKHGFMPMFQQMLGQLGIDRALATAPAAERRLTNVLHLGELLLTAEVSCASPEDLLLCFHDDSDDQDYELRLESEDKLVRIVTMHASKGLQYSIVYLPTLWDCRTIPKHPSTLEFYHRTHGHRCYDMGSDEIHTQHDAWARNEQLAEDLRLNYVAMTRACSHMVIYCGAVGQQWQQSATAHLWYSDHDVMTGLEKLQQASAENISVTALDMEPQAVVRYTPSLTPQSPCRCTEFQRTEHDRWRVLSFTAMTRHLGHTAKQQQNSSLNDSIFNFPAGINSGLLLHSLLEQLDFSGDIDQQSEYLAQHLLPRYGLDAQYTETLTVWIKQICNTPLHHDGWRLRDIPSSHCLRELEFDLPLAQLHTSAFHELLQQHAGTSLPPLDNAHWRGYLTGSIDLMLCMDGRYYIIDYKGNHLGYALDDYQHQGLQHSMHTHRYDLQAMIYTLATHRYLETRLADYDYNRDFGGFRYLFLRGMRGHPLQGVYADCFSKETVQKALSL